MRTILLTCALVAFAGAPALARGGGGGHDAAASSHGGNYYASGQGYYGGPPMRWGGDVRYYNGLPTQGRAYAP